MDDKERDEILYRLDERTKRVDDHLNRLDRRVESNANELDNHEERITNTESFTQTIWRVTKTGVAMMTALLSGLGAAAFEVLYG